MTGYFLFAKIHCDINPGFKDLGAPGEKILENIQVFWLWNFQRYYVFFVVIVVVVVVVVVVVWNRLVVEKRVSKTDTDQLFGLVCYGCELSVLSSVGKEIMLWESFSSLQDFIQTSAY